MAPTRSARAVRRHRPGVREVAERAGVAISSVSRVLSGHPDVSADMRDRVMAVVDELGYQPDVLAQGLRRQKTMSVGFAASTISNPVLTEAAVGAEGELRRAGYGLLLTDADGQPALDAANIALLARRRVDGILLAHGDEQHAEIRAALAESDVPLVLIDRDPPQGLTIPSVTFDHRTGMRQAAEHLRELGHRRVAMLVGGPRRPARQRWAGVHDAFDDGESFEGDFSPEFGYRATRELLGRQRRPTAIIAGGNTLMHGALRALRDEHVTLGRELSFVGCDDVAVAEFHEPQIAIVRRDPREAGRVGAALLLQMLNGGHEPSDVVLPTWFVSAASCDRPRE